MFSRFQRFYTSIKVAMDVGVLALAFALAYLTRFYVFGEVSEPDAAEALVEGTFAIPPELRETLTTALLALAIFPITFHQSRLYLTNRSRTHLGEVFEIFKAVITASLILVALTYFFRERYSRLTMAFFMGYAFVLVSATRLVFRQVLSELRRRGYQLKTILVIGGGDLGERVIRTIEEHRELGFRVSGVLALEAKDVGTTVLGVPVLGEVKDVDRVLAETAPNEVLIALPVEHQPLVKELMELLALHTVDVKVVPDLYQYITVCGGLEEFGGLPIINLQSGPLQGWNLIAKRAFDVVTAMFALLVVSPVMTVVAIAVKLSSRGPILYRQERMGMDGETFHILKFRTMRIDAEASGAMMASKGDPRTTWLGAFLRKTSLDELPQLFNVLTGDMSLVGPRPERPVFIEEFKKQIPKYHLRHKVKAGITGWAQINGLRGQTSIQKRIEYDLYYIENWSLLLDLKILVRTALGGFLSKNAY